MVPLTLVRGGDGGRSDLKVVGQAAFGDLHRDLVKAGPKPVVDRGDRRVARAPRWKGPRSQSTEVVQCESEPMV